MPPSTSDKFCDSAGEPPLIWQKSTRSMANGDCIEVASRGRDAVGVRDSKNPRGNALWFAAAEWSTFLGGVREGTFG